MANIFDQFDNDPDAGSVQAQPNIFDQFDNDPDAAPVQAQAPADTNFTMEDFQSGALAQQDQVSPEQERFERIQAEEARKKRDSGMGITEDPSLPELVVGGLGNAARNTVITGASLTDGALGMVGVENKGAQGFDETIPEFTTDGESVLEDVVVTGAEMAPGLVGGAVGTAKMIGPVSTKLGQIGKYLASAIGGETAAATVTANPETEPLIVGDEAAFPIIRGMVLDKNDTFNEDLWKKKVNLLGDALIVSGATGGAGHGLMVGYRFLLGKSGALRNLHRMFSPKSQEFKIVETLLDHVSKLDPTDDAKAIQQKRQAAVDYINKHKDVFIKFSDADPDLGDIEFTDDVITTLTGKLDPKVDGKEIADLEGLKASVLAGNSPDLEESLAKPSQGLRTAVDQIEETRGGSANINTARDAVIEAGQKEIDPARQLVRDADQKILNTERELKDAIKNDPTFGPVLDRLGDKVNIDFTGPINEVGTDITEKVLRASDLMTQQKNQLYDAIPDAARVNPNALADALEPLMGGVGDETLLSPATMRAIQDAGDNFKKLNKVANFQLSDDISKAIDAKEFEKAGALQDLKRNITDEQLDYLVASGDTATRDAAQRAKEFYVNEYAPFWRENPILSDVQKFSRSLPNGQVLPESRKLISRGLSDPEVPEYSVGTENSKGIADVLARDEAGRSDDLVQDFAITNIGKEVQKVLNTSGKFTPDDVKDLTNSIDQFVPILERVPGKKEAINNFLTKVRNDSISLDEMRNTVKQLEADAKQVESQVLDGKLKEFFSGSGDNRVPLPNGEASFKEILNSDQSLDKVRYLARAAESDPLAKKGLQAAYIRNLKERFFTSAEGATGTRKVNKENLDQFLRDDSPLVQYGKEIFGEEGGEIIMSSLKQIAEKAYKVEAKSNVRQNAVVQTKEVGSLALQATNMIITWTFGILNPTAARIRTVTGQYFKNNSPDEQVKAILDTVLADPDRFIRVAQEVIDSGAETLSPDQKRMLFRSLVHAGVYSREDEESFMAAEMNDDARGRPTIEAQTDEVIELPPVRVAE